MTEFLAFDAREKSSSFKSIHISVQEQTEQTSFSLGVASEAFPHWRYQVVLMFNVAYFKQPPFNQFTHGTREVVRQMLMNRLANRIIYCIWNRSTMGPTVDEDGLQPFLQPYRGGFMIPPPNRKRGSRGTSSAQQDALYIAALMFNCLVMDDISTNKVKHNSLIVQRAIGKLSHSINSSNNCTSLTMYWTPVT